MPLLWKAVLAALIGYSLGNISPGILISKLVAKDDVRKYGSGSSGTTNMVRFLGLRVGLLTLALDICKSLLASFVGWLFMGEYGALLGGLLCVIGHNWPIVYGFKGGKGIAATAGTLLFCEPLVAIVLLPLSLVAIRLVKVVSVVTLSAVTLQFVMTILLKWGNWYYIGYSFLLMVLAFIVHRENIGRMRSGEEWNRKLDFSKDKKKIAKAK